MNINSQMNRQFRTLNKQQINPSAALRNKINKSINQSLGCAQEQNQSFGCAQEQNQSLGCAQEQSQSFGCAQEQNQ